MTSTMAMADGEHDVSIFKPGSPDVEDATLTVEGGKVADADLAGSLFAQRRVSLSTERLKVQEISLDQEGLVEIKAIRFPDAIRSDTFGGPKVEPSTPESC